MTIIRALTDFDAPELDVYARLSEVQLLHIDAPAPGLFIAESTTVIRRAICAGYRPVSFLMERTQLTGEASELLCLPEIADQPNLPVFVAEKPVITQLTGYPMTRGVLAAMRRNVLPTPGGTLRDARRIAVLSDIVNPTNLGAIFRSAAALSMDAVILTHGCCDPLYRRSARVSMGTVFQVPWTYLAKNEPVSRLHDFGFTIAAMALREDALDLRDARLACAEKLALVFGSEGPGLSEEVIAECDHTVMIPMSHGVDSLNVAAASAVAFWELTR